MSSSAKPAPGSLEPRDGIYKRGFGLKEEIKEELEADYHSELIEELQANGFEINIGQMHLRLARDFGFCYGVDKAVDFAYETRRKFPDRRIFLTAEIIHNPRVNKRMTEMGIQFLSGQYASGLTVNDVKPEDVVILPAFGVGIEELNTFRKLNCILVDSTCGSVVHVWKRVEKYAKEGFTSLIHGKYKHEETIATASHAYQEGQGAYIVVFDKAEADMVCDFIRNGGDPAEMEARFGKTCSPGFDFERDLQRIGVANQTTMLSSDSMEIGAMVRQAMADRYGPENVEEHFRSFDTICHATQVRQDAVLEMMHAPPDIMIVIGGYNSSNTHHLAEITLKHCPTWHIADVGELLSATTIRHKPIYPLNSEPELAENWLPKHHPLNLGMTAGASTPNRVIGEVVARLDELINGPSASQRS